MNLVIAVSMLAYTWHMDTNCIYLHLSFHPDTRDDILRVRLPVSGVSLFLMLVLMMAKLMQNNCLISI